jgi:hypothetical protein
VQGPFAMFHVKLSTSGLRLILAAFHVERGALT